MFNSLRSVTATLHVSFNYQDKEPGAEGSGESRTQIMAKILDRASEVCPELQKLINRFADYLDQIEGGPKG